MSVDRWRRDVESAMYFLVWHRGLSYDKAHSILTDARSAIPQLAKLGRREFKKCEVALLNFIKQTEMRYP